MIVGPAAEAPPVDLLLRYWPVYVWFADSLRRIGTVFPDVVLTSWWRSREHNEAVGGEEFSQHRLAFAADLQTRPTDLERLAGVASSFGLVAVRYSGHVHVQLFRAGALPRDLFTV